MIRSGTVVLRVLDRKWKNGSVTEIATDKLTAGPIRLVVHPARPFAVRVIDPNGKALTGAKVYLGDMLEGFSRAFPTDDHGIAHPYPVLLDGRYYVNPSCDGYYHSNSVEQLPVVGSEDWKDSLDIVMVEARRTQKGKVLDWNGKPAPGVRVYQNYSNPVVTDKNGEFALPGLPDCEVRLRANVADAEGTVVVDRNTAEAVIQLRRYEMR